MCEYRGASMHVTHINQCSSLSSSLPCASWSSSGGRPSRGGGSDDVTRRKSVAFLATRIHKAYTNPQRAISIVANAMVYLQFPIAPSINPITGGTGTSPRICIQTTDIDTARDLCS